MREYLSRFLRLNREEESLLNDKIYSCRSTKPCGSWTSALRWKHLYLLMLLRLSLWNVTHNDGTAILASTGLHYTDRIWID